MIMRIFRPHRFTFLTFLLSNLAFGGTMVLKCRHTSRIELGDLVVTAVDELEMEFLNLETVSEDLKLHEVSADEARAVIVRVADVNAINSWGNLPARCRITAENFVVSVLLPQFLHRFIPVLKLRPIVQPMADFMIHHVFHQLPLIIDSKPLAPLKLRHKPSKSLFPGFFHGDWA